LRRKVFEAELAQSLAQADEIVMASVFRLDAIPEVERLDAEAVIATLRNSGKPARLVASADSIIQAITSELREGDVVAILSNGGFGGIYEKLPAALRARSEVSTPA
jgi:UDP-N-acetylmuramate: L-alanyl-gamma-D-glutamyl-meso-diaminopimelate ligase